MDKSNILNRNYVKELSDYILDPAVRNVMVNGLYSSAKSFAISASVSKGIHMVILNRKEEAAGFPDS